MATRMQQRRGTAAEWATANPVLSDGEFGLETDTKIVKIGDGVTAWNSIPTTYIRKSDSDGLYIAKAIIDAAGDLIVGSAADEMIRLPKGANGTILTITGGAVGWATPELSSLVAKAGDTMTGDLTISKDNAALLLEETATDRIRLAADAGTQYIQVDDELHVTAVGAPGTLKPLRAAALYDDGNRVYSNSNPPPGNGIVVSVTNTYAVAADVSVVLANGTFTVTIPSAALSDGRSLVVKNIGSGTITLATAGGTIDTVATLEMKTAYQSFTVVSDGTNWFII